MPQVAGARPLAVMAPLVLLALGALELPPPWNAVWLTVPFAGGAGYLANQAPLRLGWLATALAALWLVATGAAATVHGWAALGAIASATLFGLAAAARQGGPGAQRLWSLLPLLLLAAIFPLTGAYEGAVAQAVAAVERAGREAYERYRALGLTGAALLAVAEQMERTTAFFTGIAQRYLPSVLFLWAAALVGLTVLLARRACEAIGRPLGERGGFAAFAVPEGAVWLLVLGLGAVATRQEPLPTVGRNLSACLAAGYALQGLAILRSGLAARGWHGGIFWVLVVFVFLFAPPVLAAGATLVGLADVWLDFRERFRQPTLPGPAA
jgi:hypothetical protein